MMDNQLWMGDFSASHVWKFRRQTVPRIETIFCRGGRREVPKMFQDLMDLWTRYKMIQGTSHPPFFGKFPHGHCGCPCFSDLCQFTQRSMSCSQLRFLTQGTQCCKSASQRPVHQEVLQWIEEKKGILLQNMWISGLQPSCFGGFPVQNIGEFLTQRCTMLIYAAGWQIVGNIQTRVCAKFFSWKKYFEWSPPWHFKAYILKYVYSDIWFDIYSDILPKILSDTYSDILSAILSGILSGIYSCILSGILSCVFFGILSGILSDLYSDILSGFLSDILFRQSLCSDFGLAGNTLIQRLLFGSSGNTAI